MQAAGRDRIACNSYIPSTITVFKLKIVRRKYGHGGLRFIIKGICMGEDTVSISYSCFVPVAPLLSIFKHGLFVVSSVNEIPEYRFIVYQVVFTPVYHGLACVAGEDRKSTRLNSSHVKI